MRFRQLGHTGMEISEIAHGLWGMGSWTDSDDEQSQQALQLAVDLGCNFFDSAWAYGEGKSDGFLGETLRRNPNKRLYAGTGGRRLPCQGRDEDRGDCARATGCSQAGREADAGEKMPYRKLARRMLQWAKAADDIEENRSSEGNPARRDEPARDGAAL